MDRRLDVAVAVTVAMQVARKFSRENTDPESSVPFKVLLPVLGQKAFAVHDIMSKIRVLVGSFISNGDCVCGMWRASRKERMAVLENVPRSLRSQISDVACHITSPPKLQWPGILVTCLASRGKLISMRLMITSIDSKKKIESRNYDFILFSIFKLITK
jgi:hypothetical protein